MDRATAQHICDCHHLEGEVPAFVVCCVTSSMFVPAVRFLWGHAICFAPFLASSQMSTLLDLLKAGGPAVCLLISEFSLLIWLQPVPFAV